MATAEELIALVHRKKEAVQAPKSPRVRPGRAARDLPKESLPAVVDEFTAGVLERMAAAPMAGELPYTSVHANYWLSGLSGHVIKHE